MPCDIIPPVIEPELIGAGDDIPWARAGVKQSAASAAPATAAESRWIKCFLLDEGSRRDNGSELSAD
jgi:hypothetical protein